MSPPSVPDHATVLVIGGGPAGSYAASLLQREGHQVVLFESAKFPRYHVGESMLPSLRNYLRFIGLEEEFVKHGFLEKPGGVFKLVHGMRETWTDFTALGPDYATWNVIRSEMDEIMLRHAEKQGAKVFEETRVDTIEFKGEPDSSRPIAATYISKQGVSGKITFDWLVDASGRSGIMSTKYLMNREVRESLRNVAVWGYWKDVKRYGEGTKRANSAWFESLTDETGWAWVIPLHDGTTSIGIVMHQNTSNAKKAVLNADGKRPSLSEHYHEQLKFLPGAKELIGEKGNFIPGSTKSATDYSYWAPTYSGDHFRIVGDAANFIDPFFSSGVHVAMTGALSAAITICSSIRGDVTEATAQAWHDEKVGIAHTRFLFVVLSAYQQMHLQSLPILSDINADNFDKSFEMFHPVIFGLADSKTNLTDEKVQEMMDLCKYYFDPEIDDKSVIAVKNRYGGDFMNVESPVLGRQKIDSITQSDSVGKKVMMKYEVLKIFNDDLEATYIGRHPLLGYTANVELGKLGLVKVSDPVQNGSKHENGTSAPLPVEV